MEYHTNDINLELVDYKFCERYIAFLTARKKCNTNGANKQIQRVKKIVNYSIKLGYLNSNAMNSYSLEFKPLRKVALTMEEISNLACINWQRAV